MNAPTIILSPYNAATRDADVYIPVGIPGMDHTGNLFRADGVINLPLKKLRDSGSESAAGIIRKIISEIEARQE